jgi:acetyl-CoA carboxylase biotin carboxyl carrier protein
MNGLMDSKDVEKLILLMKTHDLGELQVKEGEFEFSAKRAGFAQPMMMAAPMMQAAPMSAGVSGASVPAVPAAALADSKLKEIPSPLVGTFYRAPSPDQPPFKEVGDRVSADDVICIVEAMKVMNEIKSGVNGVIRKILVENASSVEYGTALFQVEIG